MKSSQPGNKNNTDLLRYAGLTVQIFAALGLAVFIGMKADQWLRFSTPLLVWVLPLLMLAGMIYKLIKDTSKKNKE
jgi:hypothetical protein